MNLDQKDWKILGVLAQDCRISLTQLGREVGVSREVADYRLRGLLRKGIIKSFIADIDLAALGFFKHVLYLELIGVSKEKEQQIIDFLKNHPHVSWLTTTVGKWSLIFDIHSRNMNHFTAQVNEIKQYIGSYLGAYEFATLELYEYFYQKVYGNSGMFTERETEDQLPSIDATDNQLLKLLSNNARADYVELSKVVPLTPEAISRRIKQLKAQGVIKQFTIFPDLAQLGFELYNVQVILEHNDVLQEKKIINYLRQHPTVLFIYKPLAHYCDLEFGVIVQKVGALREFMQQIRSLFFEQIRIRDVVHLYEGMTSYFVPVGVFEQKKE